MIVKNCNMYEFLERISNKKIICFGMGLQLNSMMMMYECPQGWENVIKYIVDNNCMYWNEECYIRGTKYKVFSPDILKNEDMSNTYVVIFTQRCYEVIQQLDEMNELDEVEGYIFPLMQTYTCIDKGDFKTNSNLPKIPKKMHYCWFGNNPLSSMAKTCIESWKKYCPDYEIVCWDETNYDISKNAYIREAYKHGAYAFVSDYARLDILYENGGIYMDVDVELKRNIDILLNNEAYCAFSNHVPRINTGLGMGAIKGFPMLKEMMDVYKYEKYEMDYGFNKTLCQSYNTKVLVYHGMIQNGQFQVIDGMTCYPKDYFDPMSSYYYIAPNCDRAFSIHHSANTWSQQNSLAFKKVKDNTKRDIINVINRLY